MKVGDLIEIYRHVPRHESIGVAVGKMGTGVIVDIEHRISDSIVVSYVSSETGGVESEWIDKENSGIVVTMKVINESR